MPAICAICSSPQRQRIEKMIFEGVSDREIARQLGVKNGHVSVGRHRRAHVVAVARDRLNIIDRGTSERREREAIAQAAAATEEPSPAEYVSAALNVAELVRKGLKYEARLDQQAELAATQGMSPAVAQLSAQLWGGLKFFAQLGSVGGFAPARQAEPYKGTPCKITILLGGKELDLSMTPHKPPEIEGTAERTLDVQDTRAQEAGAQDTSTDVEALLDRQFPPKGSANRGSDREPAEGDDSDAHMPRAKYGLTPDDIKGY